eukprot:7678642-Alexandrium_andersonii.AAC.1
MFLCLPRVPLRRSPDVLVFVAVCFCVCPCASPCPPLRVAGNPLQSLGTRVVDHTRARARARCKPLQVPPKTAHAKSLAEGGALKKVARHLRLLWRGNPNSPKQPVGLWPNQLTTHAHQLGAVHGGAHL